MNRQVRIDRASVITLVNDTALPPTGERAPAVITRDGYLSCDAYLARDGLLRYSDGRDSWLEFRPRKSLEDAAASWANTPVTDDHPPKMVTADTWATVAKGVHVSTPVVDGPDTNGISYLRARLLITDAALIRKIKDGSQIQTSIGFTADIHATPGTTPAGDRYDAVQSDLQGNHTAVVQQGRAGPSVRVLLDGKDVPVMTQQAAPTPKADEVGAPQTMSTLVGPDGTEMQVPTWLAAMVEELKEMKKGQAPEGGGEPAPEAPAAPEPPPADALDEPAPPPAPEDEEEEKPMTPDAISELVRKRSKLVRLAQAAGVSAAVCDSADDLALARAYVKAKLPTAPADKVDGAALDALVETAASLPEVSVNPFEIKRPKTDAVDPEDPEVLFLARQGY